MDIPGKIRVSLFVAAAQFDHEFDQRQIDHKLLKSVTDERFDKKMRSRLLPVKTSSLLTYELVPAAPVIKPLETFLQFLRVDPATEATLLNAEYMVEVTAVQELSRLADPVTAMELVAFAAALLAEDVGGIIVEPYSLKILDLPQDFAELQKIDEGVPPLYPFLTIVQSQSPTPNQTENQSQVRTTSHGLARIGLPELEIKFTDPALSPGLALLASGLAQCFFEDMVRVKTENPEQDRYDFSSRTRGALTINQNHVAKANGDRYQCQGSAAVPLKLSRGALDFNINLALHGRLADKNAALVEILKNLSLL